MSRRDERFGGLAANSAEIDREVEDELSFHLEMKAQKLRARGLTDKDATAEAKRRFGDRERVHAECVSLAASRERKVSRARALTTVGQDVLYALRGLTRQPGFALAVILTLAIGIGGNTAVFSLFDAALLRSLPYSNPHELVRVWPEGRSLAEFEGTQRAESWHGLAAWGPTLDLTLTGSGDAARLRAVHVSVELFDLLGVPPLFGRGFARAEQNPGVEPVVVLSEQLWRTRFGAKLGLGERITLDGVPHTVVGVMPERLRFPTGAVELWLPLPVDDSNLGAYWGSYGIQLIARLAPDRTVGGATQELRAIAEQLRTDNPIWTPAESYSRDARVAPLQREMSANLEPLLRLLMGAVLLVLLIVCVNVATLQLARSAARLRETAIRASVGAARGRLITLLMTESVVLSSLGSLAGLGLGQFFVSVLLPRLPGFDGRFGEVGLDARVLAFAALVTLVTALGFGLFPAIRLSRPDLRSSLASGSAASTATRSQRLWQNGLILTQVTLAAILVVGAGLLISSLWRLWQVDPGFKGERVLSARLDPAAALYEAEDRQIALYDRLLERLRSQPGVEAAAAVQSLPLAGEPRSLAFRVEGREAVDGRLPTAWTSIVTADYFRTLSIPLLAGRDFSSSDPKDAPGRVIVNRTLAEQIWPGEDAVGKSVGYPWTSPWLEVIGVVEDVREVELGSAPSPAIYFPHSQRPLEAMTVVLRTQNQPGASVRGLLEAVSEIDSQIPVNDVRTLKEVAWGSIATPRLAATLVAFFAAIALVLGAIGIFAVIAYLVDQRQAEIGIRMALGANRRKVLFRYVGHALGLALGGVLLGLAVAGLFSRALSSQLYQIDPGEPRIYFLAAGLLVAVAVAAAWRPARRAASLDPLTTLRRG